ncbi:hypothetical protein CDV36_014716 [Fusarium kuroshium]|uniref:Uncharacterized protein n=2 Tax=Fusarium solani species complex TaxID=232080 RepID=A0A3M2REM6_9HYPO|nr:hypothetical protein CDV36_014716 [Fusarium kuroshium]RSL55496.1 hypothetical protein CEP51_014540 [Fusarium floridanum]
MERFAEFSGLAHDLLVLPVHGLSDIVCYLESFRRYDHKLTKLDWLEDEPEKWNQSFVSQMIRLPDCIDASFLRDSFPAYGLDIEPMMFSDAEWEQPLEADGDGTHTWSFLPTGAESHDYLHEELSWVGMDGPGASDLL